MSKMKTNKIGKLYILFSLFCCSNAILFSDKTKSFATYKVWNITLVGKLELNFKTNSKYCMLLYIDNQKYSQHGQPFAKNDSSYLEVALVKGRIEVILQIASTKNKHRLTVGENLNNLKWHTLTITKYDQVLQVQIDERSRMINFKDNIARKFRIESRLYLGGLSEDKMKSSYGLAKQKPRFFGCVEGLRYSSGSMDMSPAYHILTSERVSPECLDTCGINPCKHGGVCINYFLRAGCDCSRTGYEDDRCTKPAKSLHVGEEDYLRWKEKADFDVIKFRFKAVESDGIVFFSMRDGNRFLMELFQGKLRVAAGKANEELTEIIVQKNVFDGKWHSVVVLKSGSEMSTTVDDEVAVNSTIHVNTQSNTRESRYLYFGGIAQPKFTFGTKAKQNFVGCLQQIYYNTVDVVFRFKSTSVITGIGEVKNGCPFKNINIPTQAQTTKLPITFEAETDKVTLIREVHTRESGMGQNVIIWITAAIVIGTIIILISAACVVHHIRLRYYQSEAKHKTSPNDDDSETIPMHNSSKECLDKKPNGSNESSRAGTPTIDEDGKEFILKCRENDENSDLVSHPESGV